MLISIAYRLIIKDEFSTVIRCNSLYRAEQVSEEISPANEYFMQGEFPVEKPKKYLGLLCTTIFMHINIRGGMHYLRFLPNS